MSSPRIAACCVLAVGLSAASANLLEAQAGQSEIAGEVRDTAGALVAGASVSAVEIATERRVSTTTGAGGLFVLPSLRPGRYRLEVEKDGSRTLRRDGLEIRTGERARVEMTLGHA